MTFEEACELLSLCHKVELQDHYFGDRELDWYYGESHVATGYFGSGEYNVEIYQRRDDEEYISLAVFEEHQARLLADRFASNMTYRNDSNGPDHYSGQ